MVKRVRKTIWMRKDLSDALAELRLAQRRDPVTGRLPSWSAIVELILLDFAYRFGLMPRPEGWIGLDALLGGKGGKANE